MARRCSLTLVLVLALCGVSPAAALAGIPAVTLSLSPGGGSQDVATLHSETVTLLNGGSAYQGQTVNYTITGANATSGMVTTNSDGHATIAWTGTNAGQDHLTATWAGDSNVNDQAFVNFSRGDLFISTSSQDNIGAQHSATFNLEDGAGDPRPGATIHYSITGANPQSEQTIVTNAGGQATIMWTGTNAGTDELSAWYDFDGNSTQDPSDPSDTRFVSFNLGSMFISGATTGTTGSPNTATVNLEDAIGDPRSGATVRYTISGANPSSGAVTTNASGQAAITWTGVNGGLDTLSAYYDANGNSQQDPGEPSAQRQVNWITAITSSGPLTAINLSADMGCQAFYTGDAHGQFYGGVPGSCGTYVWIGGQRRGPGNNVPVSQTAVTGAGTPADPYRVVTVACAGSSSECSANTAPLVTQTVTYVPGRDYYRTDVKVQDRSGSSTPAVIYQWADCYLQGSDSGFGFYDSTSGGIYCTKTANNSPAGRIEGFVPLNSGSSYIEDGYSSAYSAMDADGLPNTCDCEIDQDNGMALGYTVNVPANGSVTRSLLVAFSPTGNAVDVVAPAVSLDSPANGSSTTDHTPTIAGAAGTQPGDSDTVTVTVYSGSSPSGAAVQTLPVTRSGGSWSVDSPSLANGTYTAQATQSDSDGNVGTSAPVTFTIADPPPPPPPPGPPPGDIDGFLTPPPPKIGEKVNVAPAAGKVLVKLPGTSKFIELSDAEQIPVGTTIDTKRGSVKLTSASDSRGRTQAGTFRQGVFVVRQPRGRAPVTQLQLTGKENFKACPRTSSRKRVSKSASRPKRRLWGNAKGRFSTKGRYAAATVRGTEWYTEDNCSGTLVKVRKGVVDVRDLTKRKTVKVRAGKSYLAKPRG